jgi:hypothetical protein
LVTTAPRRSLGREVGKCALARRVGLAAEAMSVQSADGLIAGIVAETLEMLRRLGNVTDDVTNGHPAVGQWRASVVHGC